MGIIEKKKDLAQKLLVSMETLLDFSLNELSPKSSTVNLDTEALSEALVLTQESAGDIRNSSIEASSIPLITNVINTANAIAATLNNFKKFQPSDDGMKQKINGMG